MDYTPLFAICYLPVPGHPWHFEVLGVVWIVRQMVGVAEIWGGSFATYASTWTGIAEGHAEGDAIEMGMKYRERNRLFFSVFPLVLILGGSIILQLH